MKQTRFAIALVAVLAIAALVAPAASAAEFKSGNTGVMLFGQDSGNHQFTVDGQAVTCTNAVFEKAWQNTPTKTIPGVSAAYNGCTAFGFAGAKVNMGTCTYELREPNAFLEGNLALRCAVEVFPNVYTETPATVKVSVFGSTCEIEIHEQFNTNLSKVAYTNNNPISGRVLVTASVSSIHVKKTVDSGLCPLSGTGYTFNGTYNGPTPIEATGGINFSVS